MSRQKLRIHNTKLDNLISNLRGEVGEIIYSWVLMRGLGTQARRLRTPDIVQDMQNPDLCMLEILREKMSDEVVARLSELAEEKIGCLTFHFASLKLKQFEDDVASFSRFIQKNGFKDKRNQDISHKELPEKFTDHRFLSIPYRTTLKGAAHALRLMKKIDRAVLEVALLFLWREARKRRYSAMHPVKVGYWLLPHISLPAKDVDEILKLEMAEGKDVWVDMQTEINGVESTIKVNKEWAIRLPQHLFQQPPPSSEAGRGEEPKGEVSP